MKTYIFEVRETTTRTAHVKAENAAQARALLNRWAYANEGHLADNGPIVLGDLESVGLLKFRSVGSREK